MEIYIYGKEYFKESKEVQNAIISGVQNLYNRIHLYEMQNVEFNRIFNDDKIKYDKHGQFYTFKFQKSNMQIRVLYTYFIINFVPVIVVADFFIKKRSSKEYITKFDFANEISPEYVYERSKVVYSK